MSKYDAILIFGYSMVVISVFLHLVGMVTDITLAEGFIVLWLSAKASKRLQMYDRLKGHDF